MARCAQILALNTCITSSILMSYEYHKEMPFTVTSNNFCLKQIIT